MQDIRCTDDLLVENGDFMVGEASEDIIERLAYASVGIGCLLTERDL